MKKKIITSLIAAAILVSGTAAFAAEISVTDETVIGEADAATEITLISEAPAESNEEVSPAFVRLEAEAVKVEENTVTVKTEEEITVAVSEDTAVLNAKGEVKSVEDIKAGDKLYIYSADEKVSVIVIMDNTEDELVNVDVDTYIKSDSFGIVTNIANTLALNLDENADITDLNGEKVAYTELENKNLAVFYDMVALSIPGQTTPIKVVVIGDAEVEEVTDETPAVPEIIAAAYTKTEAEAVKVEENTVTVKAEEETTVAVSENTAVLNAAGEIKALSDIKEGDKLYIYNKDEEAALIVIMDNDEVNIDVDMYAVNEEVLVNSSNTLALNLDENSVITDLNGENVAYTDVSDKYLAVFYTVSTRSIPAQATPEKVVVLGDAKEDAPAEAPEVQDPAAVTKVTANGNEICEVKYDSESETFMIPVRAVAETLGYKVDWEGGELRVTVGNKTVNVDFKIGVNEYTLTGSEAKTLEKAPELINDTTFIPCSLFSEVLGNTVVIEGDTLAIKAE